jgi:hypothetical protein
MQQIWFLILHCKYKIDDRRQTIGYALIWYFDWFAGVPHHWAIIVWLGGSTIAFVAGMSLLTSCMLKTGCY